MFKDLVIVALAFVIYLCALVITDSAFAENTLTYIDRAKSEKHTLILKQDSDGRLHGVYSKKPIKQSKKQTYHPFIEALMKQTRDY